MVPLLSGQKMIKMFEVGGHVRDSLLGIKSKDIDIAVEASGWEEMREFVSANSNKVFLEKPEFFTIRAIWSDGEAKDFVLCRKDGPSSDSRHPDFVLPGTIFDDLARRDFTVNAIAREVDTGNIIDPFNGRVDLNDKILRCVGNAKERLEEDSLRLIRAIRFSITKGFFPDKVLLGELGNSFWAEKLSSVSTERIREELHKCFVFNTQNTMTFLNEHVSNDIISVMFKDIWLKPTSERR